MSRPSIYEFAGGEAAFQALATAHHERCLADPELNHPFSHGRNADHPVRLGSYLGEVFGGPPAFSTRFGGHSAMLAMHAGEDIGEEFGQRFVTCFVQAVDDAGLPDDPDLRAALRAYMEWAMREVLSYGPDNAEVPPHLPTPRWSWDGLQPD